MKKRSGLILYLLTALFWAMTLRAEKFPDFTAVDLAGKTVTQAVFKENKVTMINVWGTFCGPCINEMPHLGEISREYAGKGFGIVGIVVDVLNNNGTFDQGTVRKARQIVDKTKASYVHVLPSGEMLGYLSNVQYIPDTVFVDSEGNILGEHLIGSKSKAAWKTIIDKILADN
ncbi:MAG: TlpA family protein disulfide reductase [Fusobacteriaceae bacterium]|nr:TlpA family protein disulfide reductase [Fusobacteriaceae bacterium]